MEFLCLQGTPSQWLVQGRDGQLENDAGLFLMEGCEGEQSLWALGYKSRKNKHTRKKDCCTYKTKNYTGH